MRQRGPLWTHELTSLVAARYRLTFADRRSELDFASAVAMPLRRYERRWLLAVLEKDQKSAALRWSLRPEVFGNVVPLRAVGLARISRPLPIGSHLEERRMPWFVCRWLYRKSSV